MDVATARGYCIRTCHGEARELLMDKINLKPCYTSQTVKNLLCCFDMPCMVSRPALLIVIISPLLRKLGTQHTHVQAHAAERDGKAGGTSWLDAQKLGRLENKFTMKLDGWWSRRENQAELPHLRQHRTGRKVPFASELPFVQGAIKSGNGNPPSFQ